MANKKKNDFDDILSAILNKKDEASKNWTKEDFKKIFATTKDPDKMSDADRMFIIATAVLVQKGITPEAYAEMYKIAAKNQIVNYFPIDLFFGMKHHDGEEEDFNEYDDDDFDEYEHPEKLMSFPMPGAENKSMVLKIQLRGISKPPLWREVRIPADIDFEQLHEVIQTLFGWEHAHMWQFEAAPYSHGYRIGPEMDDTGFGDGPTDIAHETPVTKVLKKAKDKMVYVYDFGDDWVHDITVKEVLDEKTDHPVCLKWKGDNLIEDIGGVWGYDEYRQMADPAAKHTGKEVKEFLDNHWFDSMVDFRKFMDKHRFNLDEANEELKSI